MANGIFTPLVELDYETLSYVEDCDIPSIALVSKSSCRLIVGPEASVFWRKRFAASWLDLGHPAASFDYRALYRRLDKTASLADHVAIAIDVDDIALFIFLMRSYRPNESLIRSAIKQLLNTIYGLQPTFLLDVFATKTFSSSRDVLLPYYALTIASKRCNHEILDYLLTHYVISTQYLYLLIIATSIDNNLPFIRYMATRREQIPILTSNQFYTLRIAAKHGHHEIVAHLVGLKLHKPQELHKALLWTIKSNLASEPLILATVKILVEASEPFVDSKHEALRWTVGRGNLSTLLYLLEKRGHILDSDLLHLILYHAIRAGSLSIVQYLFEHYRHQIDIEDYLFIQAMRKVPSGRCRTLFNYLYEQIVLHASDNQRTSLLPRKYRNSATYHTLLAQKDA